MGAKGSCSCFGSAMGTESSKMLPESESLWPRFKRRIKQKSKNQSSMPAAFSNYAVQISPTCLITEKSKAVVRIVSISQDEEFVPVILSPVGKTISNERQPTKKKTQLGFDAAKSKVKLGFESRKFEVCTEEEDEVTMKKPNRRSWVRIAKAFRSLKAPAFQGNGSKVSQDPIRRSLARYTKTAVIEQSKAQEIRQKKKAADSIPGPIEQLSKSTLPFAGVDFSKRQGIKSAALSQLQRPGMNSITITTNFQPKKMNLSAKRKGKITGDARSEGEGYSMAINLSILIVIMACLVVFSNRLLAVVCSSIWWYLLPGLLKKNSNQQQLEAKNSVSSRRRGKEN